MSFIMLPYLFSFSSIFLNIFWKRRLFLMSIDMFKILVVVIVCLAASFLGYFDKLDSQAVVAILSAALGYVYGNAHGLLEKK